MVEASGHEHWLASGEGESRMTTYAEHHEIRIVPKYEETAEGWRAFSVTALNSEGHVIRWSLDERSPDPKRGTRRVNRGRVLNAA